MMTSGIYKISFGGRKCYIGSAVNFTRRLYDHRSRLKHNKSNCLNLQRAYNKYGVNLFKFEIIELCGVAILKEREAYFIEQYDAVNNGYNIATDTAAPMMGRKHTEETKKLMSQKSKNNKARLGQKCSPEHLRRMSESMMGVNVGKNINVGESNAGAKITTEGAKKIKELKGTMFQREIAKMFGISQTQVSRIHNEIKWKTI